MILHSHIKSLLFHGFLCIGFLCCISIFTYSQRIDSLLIKNFSSGDYKASALNYSGVMDENGIFYFANENGILRYDGSEWLLIPINNFSAVFSIHITESGRIYVGATNEWGYLEKDEKEKYTYISLRNCFQDEKRFETFWQIASIDGNIYFASYEGIIKYDGSTCSLIDIDNSGIFTIGQKLYISRLNDGIYTIRNDSAFIFNHQYRWKDDYVYAAIPDLQDTSYQILYTSENGLFRYNVAENKITPFKTSNDELIKKKSLYNGHVWRDSLYVFSTWSGGLVMINPEGKIVTELNKSNGLFSNELQEFIIDKRDYIWLTSNYGIYYLQWPNLKTETEDISTIITNVETTYNSNQTLRSIEFHFATPGYDKSELLYSFYLKGYEDDFSGWKTDVKKEYTNLTGGEYEFIVKAKTANGEELSSVKYSLDIPIVWYENPLYYISFIVFSSVLIFSLFKLRSMRLKSLNRRLEKIIRQRTHELTQRSEELKRANEELTIKNTELDNFVYRSSHDLVAPLKSIKGLISLAQLETSNSNQEEYLKRMNVSVTKLEDFIQSIMEYSVNSKQEIAKNDVRFDEVIDDIRSDLQYFDQAEKVKLIKNYYTDLVLRSDERRLKIILSNLITNCIKYHNYNLEEPVVEVNVIPSYAKGITEIEVRDNGLGIDKIHLNKIFDMFYRASNSAVTGSGLGLYIVKDTVDKIGGKIDVDSEIGRGTKFKITLYDSLPSMTPSSVD